MQEDCRRLPCFMDFEASGLGQGSYPIEVAWSGSDARVHSRLIDPSPVPTWSRWDSRAECLHGLSLKRLRQEGRHPVAVARQLNRHLAGQWVICDGGEFDRYWLFRLFQAARIRPAFRLQDLEMLFDDRMSTATTEEILRQARTLRPWRHRAALDVRYLQEVWRLLKAQKSLPQPGRLRLLPWESQPARL